MTFYMDLHDAAHHLAGDIGEFIFYFRHGGHYISEMAEPGLFFSARFKK